MMMRYTICGTGRGGTARICAATRKRRNGREGARGIAAASAPQGIRHLQVPRAGPQAAGGWPAHHGPGVVDDDGKLEGQQARVAILCRHHIVVGPVVRQLGHPAQAGRGRAGQAGRGVDRAAPTEQEAAMRRRCSRGGPARRSRCCCRPPSGPLPCPHPSGT